VQTRSESIVDATILIPTHDHAALLPYAMRSALGQTASIELFVIGDGVGDDTRQALAPFLSDPRVRFFDYPKGERLGEAHRHIALQEAAGELVTYLSDDDILLPDHVTAMQQLLADADFAHPAPAWIDPDGQLEYVPFDASREDCRTLLMLGDENSIGLTGTSHTLALYRRLPRGWHPAPVGMYTDWHMWRQIFSVPGLVARTGHRLTYLHFPSPIRSEFSMAERVDELARWAADAQEPGFEAGLAASLNDAIRRSAEDARLLATRRRAHILAIQRSRFWRLRERVVALRQRVPRVRHP
jgi:GalNAc5-diNAcBac-PP-undecaprenol beta-1,3-glucosyltransferase